MIKESDLLPKELGDIVFGNELSKNKLENLISGSIPFPAIGKCGILLYGVWGTGKTTLARILIGKWTKDKPFLELNSSFYTSIDTLREKIDSFCSKVYMGFDIESSITADSMKYVFLDEFERTSSQYQDALKAYIEEFSAKNVRFILNTNHINKVSPGIRSRFVEVDFEVTFIKTL